MKRLSIPMVAVNAPGDFVITNDVFAELTGHASKEVVKMKCANVFRELGDESVLSFVPAWADKFVEPRHAEGGTVAVPDSLRVEALC
jgi:hypothetical protein